MAINSKTMGFGTAGAGALALLLGCWGFMAGGCGDDSGQGSFDGSSNQNGDASAQGDGGGNSNTNQNGNTNANGNNNNGDGLCGASEGRLFDDDHPWNQRADAMSLDAESEDIISYLQTNHTSSQRFRIDGPSGEAGNLYGITLLFADEGATHEAFTPTYDHFSPDCDTSPVPLPQGGAIEGEAGYACAGDGDCHLLVVDTAECRLFEMWRANVTTSEFLGGCLAVWDLTQTYGPTLRGDCCTSADAAGLPIAAHMFGPDEIAAGEIRHAIRFILPNEHMRERIYVRPATHSTGQTSGPADAPPYGARLRLRSDFDASALNAAARVVAVALQRYGMILSDGGGLTFTALNDRFTEHTWAEVGLGPSDLTSLEWTDFEVVELGERFLWNNACDCSRTPLSQ
ncbi:MAG: hypothetical protein RBU30_19120 [Polyangia bacterium]|jgi:serine/threonine-protein kinase|nr:hypothetical protein [Polyangia bacterium]